MGKRKITTASLLQYLTNLPVKLLAAGGAIGVATDVLGFAVPDFGLPSLVGYVKSFGQSNSIATHAFYLFWIVCLLAFVFVVVTIGLFYVRHFRDDIAVISWLGFQRRELRRGIQRNVHIIEYINKIENIHTLRLNGAPIDIAIIDIEALRVINSQSPLRSLNGDTDSPDNITFEEDSIVIRDKSIRVPSRILPFILEQDLIFEDAAQGKMLGVPIRWGVNDLLIHKSFNLSENSWKSIRSKEIFERIGDGQSLLIVDWYFPSMLCFLCAELVAKGMTDVCFPLKGDILANGFSGKSEEDIAEEIIRIGEEICQNIADAIDNGKPRPTALLCEDFAETSRILESVSDGRYPIVVGAGSMIYRGKNGKYIPTVPTEGVFGWVECAALLAHKDLNATQRIERRKRYVDYLLTLLSRRSQEVLCGLEGDAADFYSAMPINSVMLENDELKKLVKERFGKIGEDIENYDAALWPRIILENRSLNIKVKEEWERQWAKIVHPAAARRQKFDRETTERLGK